MYLRGKVQGENPDAPLAESPSMVPEAEDDLERTTEYPEDTAN